MNITTFFQINRQRVQLFVDALRSGRFQQGKGSLCGNVGEGKTPKYCCLGVACEVAIENGLNIPVGVSPGRGTKVFDGDGGYMPSAVRNWYGFDFPNPSIYTSTGTRTQATHANDVAGMTFDEIADAFERTYLGGGVADDTTT